MPPTANKIRRWWHQLTLCDDVGDRSVLIFGLLDQISGAMPWLYYAPRRAETYGFLGRSLNARCRVLRQV